MLHKYAPYMARDAGIVSRNNEISDNVLPSDTHAEGVINNKDFQICCRSYKLAFSPGKEVRLRSLLQALLLQARLRRATSCSKLSHSPP